MEFPECECSEGGVLELEIKNVLIYVPDPKNARGAYAQLKEIIVEDAGLDTGVLSDFKRKVVGLAKKSIGLTVAFIGFTFPLVLVDAYLGLGSDSLLIWGTIGATAFLLIYAIVLYFLNAYLLKKGVYSLSEKEIVIYSNTMI